MNEQRPSPIYEFGDFQLDAAQRLLRSKDGQPVALTPRVFDTLLYLVEHPGQLIDKSALLKAIWPHVVVEEGSLSQAIYELRRALGERPDEHRFIVTVPGRGYQFVADVALRERPLSEASVPTDAPAVRPGANRHQAFPRVHAYHFVGMLVLVTVALASWYGVGLGGERSGGRTESRAYEQFLMARFFFNRRQAGDIVAARDGYERSLELDRNFAPAWAGLAGVYFLSVWNDELGLSRDEALARMRDAAEQSLALDPNLAVAHLRLSAHRRLTGDQEGAREHERHAAALDPENAMVLSGLAGNAIMGGRLEDGIKLQERAVLRDPVDLVARANLGTLLYFAGRLDDATKELRTVLQATGTPDVTAWKNPDSPANAASISLAKTLIAARQFDQALALIQSWPEGQYRDQCLALVHHTIGNTSEADAALERLVASTATDPHWVAETYAQRGEIDQAFRWLASAAERSREERDPVQLWRLDIRYSPFVTSLQRDQRWKAWLRETG